MLAAAQLSRYPFNKGMAFLLCRLEKAEYFFRRLAECFPSSSPTEANRWQSGDIEQEQAIVAA